MPNWTEGVRESGVVVADPDSNLDYTWDFGTGWLPEGDTIATATVTSPDGTVDVTNLAHDAATVTAFLRPLVRTGTATATAHVVTSGGRADDRTLSLYVIDR